MISVHIEKVVYGGSGLGRLPDGRAVFVPFTAPGDDGAHRADGIADALYPRRQRERKRRHHLCNEWELHPELEHAPGKRPGASDQQEGRERVGIVSGR